ncbi:MAG: hypothetical protein ABH883_05655 [Candidatus Omnitrophota bacterium]
MCDSIGLSGNGTIVIESLFMNPRRVIKIIRRGFVFMVQFTVMKIEKHNLKDEKCPVTITGVYTAETGIFIDPGLTSAPWAVPASPEEESLEIRRVIECFLKNDQLVRTVLISRFYPMCVEIINMLPRGYTVFLSQSVKALWESFNITRRVKAPEAAVKPFKNNRFFKVGEISVTPSLAADLIPGHLSFAFESAQEKTVYPAGSYASGDDVKDDPSCGGKTGYNSSGPGFREYRRYIENALRGAEDIVFFAAPFGDTEGLAAACQACLRTDSIFAIGIFTAFTADKLSKTEKFFRKFSGNNVRILFTKTQADIMSDAGYNSLLYAYNRRKINIFDIKRGAKKILLMVDDNKEYLDLLKDIRTEKNGAELIFPRGEECFSPVIREYCRIRGVKATCLGAAV